MKAFIPAQLASRIIPVPLSLPVPDAQPETRNSKPETSSKDAQPETPNSEPETCAPSAPVPSQKRYRHHWDPFKRGQGRPSRFDADLADDLYESIERYGYSDSAAADAHDVSSSTISRWKQNDPDFAIFLQKARNRFENAQVHKVEAFVRRDGQADPKCAMWLLERSNPEKWGRPSAARKPKIVERAAAADDAAQHETRNPKHGAEHKNEPKAPKPGTPEYWDYVEEEPFPRNLSTCIVTPGRHKFYSILHMTAIPYMPGPGDPDPEHDQPSADVTPEQLEAEDEAFFQLQDAYFALPKDQRIPFLQNLYQQHYGPPKEAPQNPPNLPENQAAAPDAAPISPMGGAPSRRAEVLADGRAERGENVPSAVSNVSSETPPETPPETPSAPAPISQQSTSTPSCPETPAANAAAPNPKLETQNPKQPAAPAAAPSPEPGTQNPKQPPAPAPSQPLIRPRRPNVLRTPNPNSGSAAAVLAPRLVIHEKPPAEYTHEENIAFFHKQARLVAEQRAQEAAAYAAYAIPDYDEDRWTEFDDPPGPRDYPRP